VKPERRNVLIVAVLLAVLGALVLAVIKNSPQAQSSSLGYVPLATATPLTAAASDHPLPGGASANSLLVMIQGIKDRRLVGWSLAGTLPPLEVDRGLAEWLLRPDPTNRLLLYATASTLMVLDMQAQRSTIVAELPPASTILTAQWSPDSRALVYVLMHNNASTAYYTLANGASTAHEIITVSSSLPLDVAWLEDGRPTAVYAGIGPLGGLEARYRVYDPLTGGTEEILSGVAAVQSYSPWRSPHRDYVVYAATSWDDLAYSGVCRTGALVISESDWAFTGDESSGKSNPLITLPNMYLDRATWLDDKRILFRGTANVNCSPTGSGLYVMELSGTPHQIVQTNSSYLVAEDESLVRGIPYTLSPDHSLVAWAENDLSQLTSRVNLTTLDGASTATLYQTTPDPTQTAFEYQDQQMILQFVWLP